MQHRCDKGYKDAELIANTIYTEGSIKLFFFVGKRLLKALTLEEDKCASIPVGLLPRTRKCTVSDKTRKPRGGAIFSAAVSVSSYCFYLLNKSVSG